MMQPLRYRKRILIYAYHLRIHITHIHDIIRNINAYTISLHCIHCILYTI